MRKITMNIAAASMAAMMALSMAGCTVTETVKNESAEATTEEAFSYVKEVSEQEMIDETGIDLPTPEGASNAVYSIVVEGELTISQLSFTLDGQDMYLRAYASGETTFEDDASEADTEGDADSIEEEIDEMTMTLRKGDISGLDYDWNLDSTTTVQDREANVHISTDGAGYVAWIDPVPGILYNLCMKEGATADGLVAYAEQVFVPLQGEADGDEAAPTEINVDFGNLVQEIMDTKAGSAGSSARVEAAAGTLINFVQTYADSITAQNMEVLASEKLDAMKADYDGDFKSDFQTCLDEVVETAINENADYETDVTFNQVVNSIQNTLDSME